jgi:hypothetical protein
MNVSEHDGTGSSGTPRSASAAETAGRVAGQVGDAARQASAQAAQAGSQAAETARDVARDARERGASLAGELAGRAQSEADARKADLADRIEGAAHAVHRAGAQLEGEQDWLAHLVERGAAELGVLAQSLRTNDLRSLMGDLDGLARRQPALFAGASLAAGFALARVGRVAVAGASRADAPRVPASPPEAHPNPPEVRPNPPEARNERS